MVWFYKTNVGKRFWKKSLITIFNIFFSILRWVRSYFIFKQSISPFQIRQIYILLLNSNPILIRQQKVVHYSSDDEQTNFSFYYSITERGRQNLFWTKFDNTINYIVTRELFQKELKTKKKTKKTFVLFKRTRQTKSSKTDWRKSENFTFFSP